MIEAPGRNLDARREADNGMFYLMQHCHGRLAIIHASDVNHACAKTAACFDCPSSEVAVVGIVNPWDAGSVPLGDTCATLPPEWARATAARRVGPHQHRISDPHRAV